MLTQDQIEDWEDTEGYYTPPQSNNQGVITAADMVEHFAQVTGQDASAGTYYGLINEEMLEFQESYLKSDDHNTLKELSDLVYVIYGYARVRGWDLDEAIRRVHENNVGRCIQPDGTIKRRGDGKILKNGDYPKVYLGDLL